MKNYNKWANNNYDQVKPVSLNENIKFPINTFNGRLDSQNMPIDIVGLDTLQKSSRSETTVGSGDCTQTILDGQTSKAYHIQHYSGYEGGINDWLADTQIELNNDSWNSGWNNLASQSNYTNFILEFSAVDGACHGWFQVNYRYGCDAVTPSGGGGVSVIGDDWYVNFGLFMNDSLVAESGQLRCRGENVCVPFKVPIGSMNTKWDIRWLATVNQQYSFYTGDVKAFIEIYNASMFVINTMK